VKKIICFKALAFFLVVLISFGSLSAQTPKLFLADYNKVAAVKKSAATNKEIQNQIALLQKSQDRV